MNHRIEERMIDMSIYQALQLNASGSKNLIRNSVCRNEKIKWTLVYVLKIFLTVAFCFLFVTLFSILFGNDNSIAGVVVLLILLLVRQADFGINMQGSILAIFLLFCILIGGPRLANLASAAGAFFINTACILFITVLACHNIIMFNHFTFVLCYLLLYGYDVTGATYLTRLGVLSVGFVLCASIFYFKHRRQNFKRGFVHLLEEFDLGSSRTQWQIRISLSTASAMFIGSLLHVQRVMWIGIACMSIMTPLVKDCAYREKRRAPFNIIGCVLFICFYHILPEELLPFLGILGGIGVGFSSSYSFQNIFNTLGALMIATNLFGLYYAVFLRIGTNIFATIYCILFNKVWEGIRYKIPVRQTQ